MGLWVWVWGNGDLMYKVQYMYLLQERRGLFFFLFEFERLSHAGIKSSDIWIKLLKFCAMKVMDIGMWQSGWLSLYASEIRNERINSRWWSVCLSQLFG